MYSKVNYLIFPKWTGWLSSFHKYYLFLKVFLNNEICQLQVRIWIRFSVCLRLKNLSTHSYIFVLISCVYLSALTNILKTMVDEFDVLPNSETIKDYYLPFVKLGSVDQTLKTLLESGVRRGQAVKALVSHLINNNKLKQAAELGQLHHLHTLFVMFPT